MAKGGARKGSGRKKGVSNSKTKQIRDQALESGITPLEVMLNTMRASYNAGLDASDPLQRLTYLKSACEVAKDAAPYMHPRLSAVEVGNKDGKPFEVESKNTPDDELDERILELASKAGEGRVIKPTGRKENKRDKE